MRIDLLQGSLDMLVLKSLSWGEKHGYQVARWLESHGDFRTPPFPVSRFVLFRSHLGSGGASHEALAHYPLREG